MNGCKGHAIYYTDPKDPDEAVCDIEWCDGSCNDADTH